MNSRDNADMTLEAWLEKEKCSKRKHFHVSANDVFEKDSFSKIIEVDTPDDALALVIADLDPTWEGGIEIEDHENYGSCEMPLIDFWRTPLKNIPKTLGKMVE